MRIAVWQTLSLFLLLQTRILAILFFAIKTPSRQFSSVVWWKLLILWSTEPSTLFSDGDGAPTTILVVEIRRPIIEPLSKPMPIEFFPSLIGLTFLAMSAVVGGVLVQSRRDHHDVSPNDQQKQ
jgi:hypothetical protein